ncbi:MAG: HEAT repeat domain-containing protein [Verrucomicrobiota bacterium]
MATFCGFSSVLSYADTVDDLIRQLRSSRDYKEQCAAAKELGKVGDVRAVEPLIGVLHAADREEVVEQVTESLGEIGDSRAIEPLVDELSLRPGLGKNQYTIKTPSAVDALVKMGDKAKSVLLTELKSRDPLFRFGIVKTLEQMGWKPSNPDEEILSLAGNCKFDELVKFGEPAIKVLVPYLLDTNFPQLSLKAAETLEKLGYKPATDSDRINFLIAGMKWDELAKAASPETLIAAMKHYETRNALVKMGSNAVIPLITALKDKDAHVKSGAVWALGEIRDGRATEPLMSLLKEMDVEGVITVNGVTNSIRGSPTLVEALVKISGEKKLIGELNETGNEAMAERFMNCDNSSLAKAAMDWARTHGYKIESIPTFDSVQTDKGIRLRPVRIYWLKSL